MPKNSEAYKVVLIDDEEKKVDLWLNDLQALQMPQFSFERAAPDQVVEYLNALDKRRLAAEKDESVFDVQCEFDEADVIVVDFDLRYLRDHQGFATGEEIAYAARMFTRVAIIVVVNHPAIGPNDFDLTLQKDRDLKGDVYIGHDQIANPGLWQREPGHDSYLPWAWPVIDDDITNFDVCLKAVQDHGDANVASLLGVESQGLLPSPQIMSFLSLPQDGQLPISHIISDESRIYASYKDIKPLQCDQERCDRVTAAVLKTWLRKCVLTPQTFFADLPHLISAVPWALTNFEDEESWTAVCGRTMPDEAALKKYLRPEVLEGLIENLEWFGRPVFNVPLVRKRLEGAGIPKGPFPFSKLPKIIFAEDLSRFLTESETDEFTTDLDGQTQLRAVSNATAKIKKRLFDPKVVIYRPQSLMT